MTKILNDDLGVSVISVDGHMYEYDWVESVRAGYDASVEDIESFVRSGVPEYVGDFLRSVESRLVRGVVDTGSMKIG